MHGLQPMVYFSYWVELKQNTHENTKRQLHVMTLTGDACMVIADNFIMSSAWKECNMLYTVLTKLQWNHFDDREIHSVLFFWTCKISYTMAGWLLTLCINTRVQRVLRNLSTTPARALLSTADDTGSRWYICVQCCPARSKCGMQLCMEWYTASPALLLNGCSGISGILERSLSPAKVRSHAWTLTGGGCWNTKTSSDGECGAVSCATVALVCPYVRCACWFAAAAIADISTDSRYQLGHWAWLECGLCVWISALILTPPTRKGLGWELVWVKVY